MSDTIGKKLTNIFVKILLGLLIVSFGIWGIGDYISPGPTNLVVATIGKQEISTREFTNEVNQRVQRMRSLFGDDFTMEQAKSMGVVDSVLDQIVQRRLFTEGAQNMGLLVDDVLISKEIKSDPRFHSSAGHFDRNVFNQAIYNAGLNESTYAAIFRGDLIRSQLLSGIEFGRVAPSALADAIYRYRNEKRTAEVLQLNHKSIRSIPSAVESQLKKYHKDNAVRFTAPEYREITLVQMRKKDLVDEIDVPEKRIKEEYENRINEFKTQEKRTIQQILTSNEKKAQLVYQKLLQGGNFFKVAKDELNLEKSTMELGTLSRSLLPLPELADAAFELPPNTFSNPIKTALGWHILRVTKVQSATVKTLADVSDNIKKQIAEELSVDALYDLSNKFEDELGGGATIDEAAKRLNFEIRKIPFLSNRGQNVEEKPVEDIAQGVVKVAFETPDGEDSSLTEDGDNGYFILHVDKTIPPALRPFDKIFAKVAMAWKEEQQAKSASKNIKKLMKGLSISVKIQDIAKELNLNSKKTEPFLRNGQGLKQQLPGGLIGKLFKAKTGDAVSAEGNGAHFIAVLTDVKAANPVADKQGFDELSNQISGGLAEDLTIQLGNAMRREIGVTINRQAVDTIY